MATTIFDAPLTGAFQATRPILFKGERVALDFLLTVGSNATVEWYLEFASEDPNAAGTDWYREVSEEDLGGGLTNMAIVVRTFRDSGGGALPVATHRLDAQFIKAHQFFRVQIRVNGGTVTRARIRSVFGEIPISP